MPKSAQIGTGLEDDVPTGTTIPAIGTTPRLCSLTQERDRPIPATAALDCYFLGIKHS